MADPLDTLTEKEKETLRLIARGHDAKSAAGELDLSVHTINDRLRAARRKLDVTSSREAARRVLESDEQAFDPAPENLGHKPLGDANPASIADPSTLTAPASRRVLWIGGIAMMSLLALTLVLVAGPNSAMPEESSAALVASDIQEAGDAAREESARGWLALVDAGEWEAAYDAGSQQMREAINLVTFRSATNAVREPLGKVLSRETISIAEVRDQGKDYVIVRFRTDFENQNGLIEQIALERDGDALKVTGYFFV